MSTESTRLAGKTAIVTGGASGIGRAACERFAAAGATVVVADRDGDAAAEVAQAIGGIGVAADVRSQEELDHARDAALDATGRIDALYANAGVDGAGSAVDTTEEHWTRVVDINLSGVWRSAKAVLPTMVEQGAGSIVTQSSTAGMTGVAGLAAYSAAKGGVIALTRQIAVEYGRHGVRANAICPGTVWTPLVERTYHERGLEAHFGSPENMIASSAKSYPLKRLGQVEEVADLALFLASDEASWITGGTFPADGGYTAK